MLVEQPSTQLARLRRPYLQRDPVVRHVMELIAKYAEVEPHNVDLNTGLNDLRYLGLDSLVLMGVILEAGEAFGVDPGELVGAEIETVGDLVDVVGRRRREMRRREPRSPKQPKSVRRVTETLAGTDMDCGLEVVRTGISFGNVHAKRVRIEITVTNTLPHPSPRTPMRLQAAPLGAFLPWRDLTTLWIPPLEPGATVTVDTEVESPRPRALGRFDRVPPQRLLTALGMEDEDDAGRPQSEQSKSAPVGWMSRLLGRKAGSAPQLPADPADLMGRPNPHWAGNINVLIGKTAVERHRAQSLRIYPGRTNVALLFVGNRQPDEYSFDLSGEGATWSTRLESFERLASCRARERIKQIELATWHPIRRTLTVSVIVEPPEWCNAGELEVHVTRKSTGQTAIVEFSLDPRAQGPGCYTM